ncbi:copper transporter [Cryomyces antarcticus]|uniref:Copper transport protein n=1 Tax=Cryomyces antarcticus TaxID=329879 RepID=A0ABR0M8T5_9PEZI|nr:hypothetical protein LTR60_001422 [Cryomyces antarcticus]KAK5019411.1 hypothetical protein LTR39_000389 [Cryomyces antarcticus]KAK5129881.1 hypothetical protein LTR04_005019 [Oleoguttula sp. CCFEE 6159]KAK5296596.1 hypothetical protein LTR16_000620 [Cryomyces antarcticus]
MAHVHGSTTASSSTTSTSTSSMTMDASQMRMVFFSSLSTPLFSSNWTPTSSGSYAGTCIFLIILSILYRASFAAKHRLEQHWLDKALKRRYVVVAGQSSESETVRTDSKSETALLTTKGAVEDVKVVQRPIASVQPWRFTVDLPRAVLVTTMAGVGYLLMLAVMTLNVGYFLSILAGTFVGELLVGRYAQVEEGHH